MQKMIRLISYGLLTMLLAAGTALGQRTPEQEAECAQLRANLTMTANQITIIEAEIRNFPRPITPDTQPAFDNLETTLSALFVQRDQLLSRILIECT